MSSFDTSIQSANGVRVHIHYTDGLLPVKRSAEIQSDSLQRRYYNLEIRGASEERIQMLASRILRLDASALKKLPEYLPNQSYFSEVVTAAALLSENPQVHNLGVEWFREEKRFQIILKHEKKMREILSYFRELDRWNSTPPPSLEVQEEFFALPASPLQKQQEQLGLFCKKYSFEVATHIVFHALWDRNHPHHDKCKAALDEMQNPREGHDFWSSLRLQYGPVIDIFLCQTPEIPAFIRETIPSLGYTRGFIGRTQQEALSHEEMLYLNKLVQNARAAPTDLLDTTERVWEELLSEDPEERTQGEEMLLEERKGAFQVDHFYEEARINSYFDDLEKWENEPASTGRQLELEQKFFTSLTAPEDPNQEFQDINLNALIHRILWFKNHPCHDLCENILREIFECWSRGQKPEGNFLVKFIYTHALIGKIPSCILDTMELPGRIRIFPRGLTRETALQRAQARHEKMLKTCEKPLPPSRAWQIWETVMSRCNIS